MFHADDITKAISHVPVDSQILFLQEAVAIADEVFAGETKTNYTPPYELREKLVLFKLKKLARDKFGPPPVKGRKKGDAQNVAHDQESA